MASTARQSKGRWFWIEWSAGLVFWRISRTCRVSPHWPPPSISTRQLSLLAPGPAVPKQVSSCWPITAEGWPEWLWRLRSARTRRRE